MIPQLIHQTWKTANAPHQWRPFIETVQRLNPDWTYHLWTDEENEAFVRREFPAFLPVYMGFSRNIMRADVIRYLLMYRLGGVYLDLDYEVLQPFDFDDHAVVLPLNRSVAYGDARNELGNCFFASVPGHPFWRDVIDDLQQHPPDVAEYTQVVEATGPMLLTKVFERHTYHDVYTPERMIYHPPSPTSARDVARIKSNGISRGIHHPWGSWKERWSMAYWKHKVKKLLP